MTIESKWLDHWFGSYGILKSLAQPRALSGRIQTRRAFTFTLSANNLRPVKCSPRLEAPGLRARLREALQNSITSKSINLVQICDIDCQSNMEWPIYNMLKFSKSTTKPPISKRLSIIQSDIFWFSEIPFLRVSFNFWRGQLWQFSLNRWRLCL